MAENINDSVTLEKLFNLINAAPEKNRQDLVNRAYEAIKPRITEIIEEYKEFYVFFEQLKAFCISTGENYAVSMPNDIDFNKAKSDGEHDEALVEEQPQSEGSEKTEQTEPNTPEPSEDGKDSDDNSKSKNEEPVVNNGNSQKESEVKDEEPDTSDKQKQEELLRKLQELAHQNSAATGIPYEDCLEFLSKKTNIKAVA